MFKFLIQHGADVSSLWFSELSLLETHTEMCGFLTRLGVPFRVFQDEYD